MPKPEVEDLHPFLAVIAVTLSQNKIRLSPSQARWQRFNGQEWVNIRARHQPLYAVREAITEALASGKVPLTPKTAATLVAVDRDSYAAPVMSAVRFLIALHGSAELSPGARGWVSSPSDQGKQVSHP